jgi:thiamine biosynthesis lipoprotein
MTDLSGWLRRATAGMLAALFAGACVASCLPLCGSRARLHSPPSGESESQALAVSVERARYTMGTTASVRIETLGSEPGSGGFAPQAAESLAEGALDRIDEVDRSASLYRGDSDLVRVNAGAWPGPAACGPLLSELLGVSLRIARGTRGAFDPTVKPLMDELGFYREIGSSSVPGGLEEALARVGWRKVRLSRSGAVRFQRQGMALDLGGIGKGYALDRAAAFLRSHGVTVAQIDLGDSSWFFLGRDPRTPDGRFRLVIREPGSDSPCAVVAVPEGSVSTSAPMQQTREALGRIVGHIVDPRRGPIHTRVESATVWARTGAEADALSTALVVAGPEGIARFSRRFHFEALLLLEHGRTMATSGLTWTPIED